MPIKALDGHHEGFMKQHNFYFRCKACNRLLKNHSRKGRDGTVQESDLCSICTGSAFDDIPERIYEHQGVTDILICSSDDESDFG